MWNGTGLHKNLSSVVLTCYGRNISKQIGCEVKFRVFAWNDFKVDQTKPRVSGSIFRNTDNMGVPYDYESIMHYGTYVRKFHWMAFPNPLLVHPFALHSDWSSVLRRLRFLRELNFSATWTGRPNQITYRQHLRRICVHLFHGQDWGQCTRKENAKFICLGSSSQKVHIWRAISESTNIWSNKQIDEM